MQSDISGVAAGSSEELSDGCRHDFLWVVPVLISMMLLLLDALSFFFLLVTGLVLICYWLGWRTEISFQ